MKDAYADLDYSNDTGYLPDGTPINRAGNAINHPETIQPDRHAPGSPLPRANFVNDVGYLPDARQAPNIHFVFSLLGFKEDHLQDYP